MKECYSRRDFFRTLGLGTLGFGFGVSMFGTLCQYAEAADEETKHQLLMKGTVDFRGFVAKEITPNNEFYITTYSDKVPDINYEKFSLRIEGLVEKPYQLTMRDLEKMKDKEEFVTLECIGNPVGGDSISNALWEGVTLKKILDRASPKEGIVKAVFHADDGYSDSIPYSLARSEDVFLAYKMNGEPLPKIHGYPLRMIVPGIYGMKHVKWISKVELVNYDFKGYWEKRGWSDESVIPVMSAILMPMEGKRIPLGNYVLGGIAFGGRHGISRVQVSLDDRETWQEAEVKKPLSKWSWVLWRYDWKPNRAREYTITVRGIDRSGNVQESPSLFGKLLGSYPNGSRGLHSVHVRVA
ncbi:MAG TPA: molybdopterin-dependent oxidoreductase [Thermodesulfovibrionales bacterium]|nr:molybdopterin-dependent oxidoreductase [Thermodesulfovibrionales bacterium]